MHAIYFFRADTDDLVRIENKHLSWMKENGNENNWYETLCCVNSKGERRKLDDDYMRRDPFADKLLEEHETVESLKKLAWVSVVVDSHMFYPDIISLTAKDEEVEKVMKDLSLEEWPEWFIEKALKKVQEHYAKLNFNRREFMANRLKEDKKIPLLEENWERRKLVRYLEEVLMVYRFDREQLPFLDVGTPHDFRAFMLYPLEEEEGESVLAADIHT